MWYVSDCVKKYTALKTIMLILLVFVIMKKVLVSKSATVSHSYFDTDTALLLFVVVVDKTVIVL